MFKYVNYTAFIFAAMFVFLANARAEETKPKFLILKIAEKPQQIVAENTVSEDSGAWSKTKEVSSDVWDGTKEVGSDVWDGTKKVSKDIWSGAKVVGSDVKQGIVGSDDNAAALAASNGTEKQGENK